MPSDNPTISIPAKLLWTGRILTALPVLLLAFSATMKFLQPRGMAGGFMHLGIPLAHATGLGIVELACTVIYLIPRTSILGAILLTGYLGGATATHVRVGDPYFATILLGVLIWGALFLREPRLRALIPLRS